MKRPFCKAHNRFMDPLINGHWSCMIGQPPLDEKEYQLLIKTFPKTLRDMLEVDRKRLIYQGYVDE